MDMAFFVAVFILLTLLSAIAFIFAFWIWMLVDCVKRDKLKDKLVWIIVLIFLNIIGALIYFFIVKNAPHKKSRKS